MRVKLCLSLPVRTLLLSFIFCSFFQFRAAAQAPVITSFTPGLGIKGTTVNISGTGFNTTDTNNVVFIGATQARVVTASATSLSVTTDTCNSYGPIQVLNEVSGLSGTSGKFFTPTFTNSYFFPTFNFKRRVDFLPPSAENIYIVAIGDLDNDNKSDLVALSRGYSSTTGKISVYKNVSSVGTIDASSFDFVASYSTSAFASNVRLADLDGDGWLDVLVSAYGSARINVYQNVTSAGTIALGTPVNFNIAPAGITPNIIAVADIDGDGHPEITASASDSDRIVVLRSLITTPGTITTSSFDTAVGFPVGDYPTGTIAIDLDGDGKIDLANVDTNSNTLSILRNTSAAGTISASSFASRINFTTGNSPIDLAAADIDGDGKSDIVCTNFNDSTISIFRNTSTSGTISLSTHQIFRLSASPVGVSISDYNGDGKLDIAVAEPGTSSIAVFRNTASAGSITSSSMAAPVRFTISAISGYPFGITSGDLDGDGYPDIVTGNSYGNRFSIIRDYPLPLLDTIVVTGSTTICYTGGTVSLTNSFSGGTWGVTNPALATVSTSGNVTAIAPGIDTVFYYRAAGGDTNIVYREITIDPSPDAGTIVGPFGVCIGSTVTLSDTAIGGTWSSGTPSVATIDAAGNVTALTAGTTNITYTLTNTCGTDREIHTILVNSLPNSGTITGPSVVCVGANITLTDTVAGGIWSSSSTATATVSSAGIVHGIAAGAVTISYIVNSGCGADTSYKTVTVNPLPVAGTISGSATVCEAANTTLSVSAAGGSWSSSNIARATVSTTGIVTGVSAGSVTISYSVSNSCGTAHATWPVTVNPLPVAGVISGISGLCRTGTTALSSSAGGGTWGSSAPSIATISSGGVVTALTIGHTTISYSVTNSCGVAFDTMMFSVDSLAPSVGAITGADSVCAGGATILLSDTATGGVWSSSATGLATINTAGLVTGLTAGSLTVTYTITNACGTNDTTKALIVKPLAAPGVITGLTVVCPSATITLSDTATGGTWSSSAPATATISTIGVVTGLVAGSVIISYTKTNSCGARSATYNITVNPMPTAGPITGTSVVCEAATTTLADTAIGGSWSSSNPAIATVSTAGVVTGVMAGTAVITYSITNSCGTADSIRTITVNLLPVAGTITGLSAVCAGASITLTDTASGGTWSSSASGTATVSTSGVVTGVVSGSAIISYSVTNGCGTARDTQTVVVNPLPLSGTLSGASSVCRTFSTAFASTATGGVWSSSNTSVATVSTSGSVTGVAVGSAVITYTVTNVCGTATSTRSITVDPLPFAGTISGLSSVCAGSTITLTDTASGGVWSSSASGVATVSTTGIVTGVTSGSAIITFSVTNSCGTVTDTQMVTVNPLPVSGTLSGTSTICRTFSTTFSSTATGGAWSSSNTSVATVSTSGNVTGVAVGTAVITYTVTNSCGTSTSTRGVTVNPLPFAGSISGPATVCEASAITLTDTASGGTWSSSSSGVATVSTSGIVTGVTGGFAIITYSVTNSCGTVTDTQMVIVNPLPVAGSLSGTAVVCAGLTTTFSTTGTGGTWSSSNTTVATVNASGTITGLIAGSATISYTVTNGCGSAHATRVVTVNPQPFAGVIAGPGSVCVGASVTLTDTATGGTWSASSTATATVSTTGVVTGVAAGTVVITYSVTNSCGTATDTAFVTVNPLPVAGTISGRSYVCLGDTARWAASVTGGVWSSSNTALATVSSTGIITGVATGSPVISYTVTNVCGSASVTNSITVITVPAPAPITGVDSVCMGATILNSGSGTIAAWTFTNGNATVVSFTGTTVILQGVTAGLDTLTYRATNACGSTVSAPRTIKILQSPVAGAIVGPGTVCPGATITLTNSTASSTGVWSTTSTLASVNGGGVVRGIAAGAVTITYTVNTPVCGSAFTTHGITILPIPNAGSVSGADSLCPGSTATFTSTAAGVQWRSLNTAIATIDATGLATALSTGVTTIYALDSNACGMDTTGKLLVVKPSIPSTGSIVGADSACAGSVLVFTNTVSGGVWSSSNTSVATISGTGTVTALSGGSTILSYTVSNGCGSLAATHNFMVASVPDFTSTLTRNVCDSDLFSYVPTSTITPEYYTWTRAAVAGISNTANAGSGSVSEYLDNTGVTPVAVLYTYIAANHGCYDTASVTVTVNPYPHLVDVADRTVCSGTQFVYHDSITTGPTTSSAWSRAGVSGILPFTNTGSGNINEILTNTTTSNIAVHYTYILNFAGCTDTASLKLTVSPSPEQPYITTHSAGIACSQTQYQNFGALNLPPAGERYTWYTTGVAQIWATGADRQYCLVNFPQSGPGCVYLRSSMQGSSCIRVDSFKVNISEQVSDKPEVIFFGYEFIVKLNDRDSYQWGYDDRATLDSVILPGQTNQHYTNLEPDFTHNNYWVITTKNGCMQKSYLFQPAAVQELSDTRLGVVVTPNPNDGKFSVQIEGAGYTAATILITDVAGRVVLKTQADTSEATQITVNEPAGVYLLTVLTENGRFTRKIVIH